MTSIKAIEFKYFTIGLECGEGNVLIAFHFHKCELKEKLNEIANNIMINWQCDLG